MMTVFRTIAARAASLLVLAAVLLMGSAAAASPAGADVAPPSVRAQTVVPQPQPAPLGVGRPDGADATISVDLGPNDDGQIPSQSIVIILLLSLLAVAPALIIMLTSFTRIVVVLSLVRNAIGVQTVPPNQVIVGLALFLSLFVMAPTLSQVYDHSLQPLLRGRDRDR